MSKGVIIAFAKTPGVSPLKTRLAATIGQDQAEIFYRLSVKATEEYLEMACALEPNLEPRWGLAEVAGFSNELWKNFEVYPLRGLGLGERLGNAYENLLSEFERVFFIGTDSPHLDPNIFSAAWNALNQNEFVLGRTDDGGFYLFGGRVPIQPHHWGAIEYSSDKTAEQLIKEFSTLGRFHELPREFDVDTKKDLLKLRKHLEQRRQTKITEQPSCGTALTNTDEKILQFIETLSPFLLEE